MVSFRGGRGGRLPPLESYVPPLEFALRTPTLHAPPKILNRPLCPLLQKLLYETPTIHGLRCTKRGFVDFQQILHFIDLLLKAVEANLLLLSFIFYLRVPGERSCCAFRFKCKQLRP